MAQTTRQTALHALWVKSYNSQHQRLFIKGWALQIRDNKVQKETKIRFPKGSVLSFVLQSVPSSGSGGKQLLENIHRFGIGEINVGVLRELGSRCPITNEKLRTRAVVLTLG